MASTEGVQHVLPLKLIWRNEVSLHSGSMKKYSDTGTVGHKIHPLTQSKVNTYSFLKNEIRQH